MKSSNQTDPCPFQPRNATATDGSTCACVLQGVRGSKWCRAKCPGLLQSCAELSGRMDTSSLCAVQYGSHSPHVGREPFEISSGDLLDLNVVY